MHHFWRTQTGVWDCWLWITSWWLHSSTIVKKYLDFSDVIDNTLLENWIFSFKHLKITTTKPVHWLNIIYYFFLLILCKFILDLGNKSSTKMFFTVRSTYSYISLSLLQSLLSSGNWVFGVTLLVHQKKYKILTVTAVAQGVECRWFHSQPLQTTCQGVLGQDTKPPFAHSGSSTGVWVHMIVCASRWMC